MDLVDRVYDMTVLLPHDENYGIRAQITRAAVSIPLNIAEGSAKSSERDYARFLETSLGSAFEVETLLIVVQRRKWIAEKVVSDLIKWVTAEQMMLQSFIKKLG